LLRASRASLEYPRKWTQPPDLAEFEGAAEHFRQNGFVTTADAGGLFLEVALAAGPASRTIEPSAETALLHVTTDVKHPLAGVGYLCTIALPLNPPAAQQASWCAYLNEREHEQQDFIPRLGAWGLRGVNMDLAYGIFLPITYASSSLPLTLMNWMVQRTLWLKLNYWTAGRSLGPATSAA
jgi:hypothetical protein